MSPLTSPPGGLEQLENHLLSEIKINSRPDLGIWF